MCPMAAGCAATLSDCVSVDVGVGVCICCGCRCVWVCLCVSAFDWVSACLRVYVSAFRAGVGRYVGASVHAFVEACMSAYKCSLRAIAYPPLASQGRALLISLRVPPPVFVMPQFTKAVELKQVAEQEAERAKFVVLKAEQVGCASKALIYTPWLWVTLSRKGNAVQDVSYQIVTSASSATASSTSSSVLSD